MSLGIYPVFEQMLKGDKFNSLGEVLAANFEVLDTIALSAAFTPLTAFADNRPIPDDFEGHPNDLDDVMDEWTEWFDPAEGQAAIQVLADYLKEDDANAERLDDSGGVIEELEELARVLGVASEAGVRFRLQMS